MYDERGNLMTCYGRQYLGGLNIAEIRVAQQYKPIVPGKTHWVTTGYNVDALIVQVKQKVEWFLQHIEDVNNLRLELEGNNTVPY